MRRAGWAEYERMFDPSDIERLPVERLEAELCHHAARSAAAMYQWLGLVGEYDRRDAAGSWGCRSTATWLAWKCGLDGRTARDHVRVARALPGLPAVSAAFASGELPYSKVRAITRVATAATEGELLDFARAATTEQLERTVRGYQRGQRNAGAANEHPSVVHPDWDNEATGRLAGRLTADDAALVFAALDAGAERLAREQRESGSAEPCSPLAQRRAAALVEMAAGYLGERSHESGGDQFLVVVHADIDEGTATLESGAPVDATTLERLLCDQPVAALIRGSDGNPLFLGRTTKVVSRTMRRALKVRDGDRCAFPGCTSRVNLHGHHVRWWRRDLGPTDITNLLLLCSYHHTRVHKEHFTIEGDGRGHFTFLRADGAALDACPTMLVADGSLPPSDVASVAGGDGEHLDLADAVLGMTSLLELSAQTSSVS